MARYQCYYKIPDKRRYRNPVTEEEISDRQYRKLKSQAHDEKVFHIEPDAGIISNYTEKYPDIDISKARNSPELHAVLAAVMYDDLRARAVKLISSWRTSKETYPFKKDF